MYFDSEVNSDSVIPPSLSLMVETHFQQSDGGGGGGALNSLRNFRLQKKKFTAGTFDSDTSADQASSQSQQSNGASGGATDVSSDIDSPIKPAGGKRILDDTSEGDSSQVCCQRMIVAQMCEN